MMIVQIHCFNATEHYSKAVQTKKRLKQHGVVFISLCIKIADSCDTLDKLSVTH